MTPYVSIAYSSADGPMAPIVKVLAKVKAAPASTRVESVELIVLHRDRRMYEWEAYATIPLASGS
ncbi:2'-5' RNA ligase family protein [Streptomyces sp. ISL-11]|uniref:2'-5' RNA ligase family protein n=1 Tax=Streptomyces sp. ISL-11 TaxID=2819174 RepID=UPI001BEA6239|nr:2'-5' RNA ligase family protein [Streptomyces sp. ISL-11]MBT2384485.1 hypothetical protein [Streptomyces sp. ISL-11]